MLTYTEIPGIYMDVQKGVCIAIDQIEIKTIKSSGKLIGIEILNPTIYPAKVKLFVDKTIQQPLSQTYLRDSQIIDLMPRETKRVNIKSL